MRRNEHSILALLIKRFSPLLSFPLKKSHFLKIKQLIASFLIVSLLLPTLAPPAQVFATVNYTYDANGNMTSDGTNCYRYNEANQLADVKNCASGQLIESYLYDYNGIRIVKKDYVNGVLQKTTYTPDKSYETVKVASSGATLNTTYYYANDELIARKNPDSTKTFYLTDNLHSTASLVDQAGNLVEKTSFYPFGDIRSGGTQSKYLFTGKEKDVATGLNYFDARYYNSHIRRFTQPDTLLPNIYDPQLLNRYSYVRNNPLTYTDPSGHEGVSMTALLGIGFVSLMMLPILLNPNYRAATSKAITDASKLVWKTEVNAVKSAATAVHNIQLNLNQQNNSNEDRKSPNPNGQKGSPAHQAEIKNIINETPEGTKIRSEFSVDPIEETFESGKVRRQVDLMEFDANRKPNAIYQVGRTTQGGMPVSREMQAIEDIKSVYPDVPVLFKSYTDPMLEVLQF